MNEEVIEESPIVDEVELTEEVAEEVEPTPEYKPCLSNGREVNWRKLEDGNYEAHDGSGAVATAPWERFQNYLDGKSGWPG
jgi:hypothetical protein